MKFLLFLTPLFLYAIPYPVNKLQVCESYYSAFLASSEAYEDTHDCKDATYAVKSAKHLIYSGCELFEEDVPLIYKLNQAVKQCNTHK